MKKFKTYALGLSLFIGAGIIWWLSSSYFDFQKPEVRFKQDIRAMGRQKTVDVSFSDGISGLHHTEVTISQGDRSILLQSIQLPRR